MKRDATVMTYSIGQAATATGKSKSTISRAIKNGRISAIRSDNGTYIIEPSELHRVFSAIADNSSATPKMKRYATQDGTPETAFLQQEITHLKALVDDLKQDRDRWHNQAQKVTALIENRTAKHKGWWKKLTGGS